MSVCVCGCVGVCGRGEGEGLVVTVLGDRKFLCTGLLTNTCSVLSQIS